MCGICGFASRHSISVQTLDQMSETIIHRGPDDSGTLIFESDNFYIGLAQQRLSILDLSDLGHQPMQTYDKRVSIVFNGEIYNFKEIKQQLDYPFVSDCDTEVILAAYLKWGIDALTRLKGMFAIALYDHRDDTLYLARDRVGKKPLYYYLCGGNLIFASELKPLMAHPGFSKQIRPDILPRYLYHGYICEPDTIFENTFKLEPGKFLVWKAGKTDIYTYWDLLSVYHERQQQQITNYEEAKRGLLDKLTEAVRQRLIADVPVGTFLSGGYDSSLVTAIAQRISCSPVKTFCIGFFEDKWNEAPYAKAVADYLGTDHTELYVQEQEMLDLVYSIPRYYDEPFGDSSQIPTMLVSKLARQRVTVALSGDGGDELFCGYNNYDAMPTAQRLDFPGAIVNAFGKLPLGSSNTLMDQLPFMVQAVARNRNKDTKTQFGGHNQMNAVHTLVNESADILYMREQVMREPNWQKRRMLLDMLTYLPGDILCKVDRASMKYSLETRCPILDTEVVEYSFQLGHSLKYYKKEKKRILKTLVHDMIPREMMERPKTGFGVPREKWLRGPLRDHLIAVSRQEVLRKQGLFDGKTGQSFVDLFLNHDGNGSRAGENPSTITWHFLMFQLWYEHYISPLT